jgi:uncharacterized protein
LPVDTARISQELQIRRGQVESTLQLLDEGNTVPFITRYRKERTGGLNEDAIRAIQARASHQRQLAERKQTILKSIEGQGKLTDELRAAIVAAETPKRLEDLYLPYKPKKRSLATAARERGLEPLAMAIWNREAVAANLAEVLPGMVNPEKGLASVDDVQTGVGHILAEQIAETAEIRAGVRSILWESGKLCTAKSDTLADGQGLEYKDYFEFSEPVRHIPAHRILAINRGEKGNALKTRLEFNAEAVQQAVLSKLPLADHPHAEFLKKVADDALTRLILPSLEREIRRELSDEAEEHAVRIFARNLHSLLMQPPLRGKRVLAIDPGFRTGCKVAALDEIGNLLEHGVIYPHTKPDKDRSKRGEKPTEERPKSETPSAPVPAPEMPPTVSLQVEAPPVLSMSETTAPPAEETTELPPSAPDAASGTSDLTIPVSEVASATLVPSAGGATVEFIIAAPSPVAQVGGVTTVSAAGPQVGEPLAVPAISARAAARKEAKEKLEELIRNQRLNVIAIGNGTACRETEEVVSDLIQERLPDMAYVIVNEAGASVYSASPVGREEFPDFDATLRGTISIGRRLQDPLSELVKIDPQNIGVGLYQHDVHLRRLRESLEAVVESCVNQVGVDLNTASVPLLRHVSGLNQLAARELVDYRKQHGPFKNRDQIRNVPGIGPARFVQAAGFLKIDGGDNALDQTWIHPESYPAAQRLLSEVGFGAEALPDKQQRNALHDKLKGLQIDETCKRLEIGQPTLRDIMDALARPGRDPREEMPLPVFKKGILKLEDLQPGMELRGTVLNVVDFGAFVDIGLKDSGLVHISQMATRFVKNSYDIAAVGDVVTVWVLLIDRERRRVSLTMIKPGSDRKPPEKKPAERPPRQQGDRPPRGRRQPPRQTQPGTAPPSRPAAQPVPPPAGPPEPKPAAATPPRPAAQQPPPRPRKPHREAPKPKLSQAALEGAAPLRTFSELKAFFEAQRQPEPPPKPADGAEPTSTPAT